VKIVVNGEARNVPEGLTIPGLLEHLALRPDRVAIERNFEILPRTKWKETAVEANDRYEIVHLVGGGQRVGFG
jgi:thiamine biosynthesis protein ThiS